MKASIESITSIASIASIPSIVPILSIISTSVGQRGHSRTLGQGQDTGQMKRNPRLRHSDAMVRKSCIPSSRLCVCLLALLGLFGLSHSTFTPLLSPIVLTVRTPEEGQCAKSLLSRQCRCYKGLTGLTSPKGIAHQTVISLCCPFAVFIVRTLEEGHSDASLNI